MKNDQSFDQSNDKHDSEEWKKRHEEKIVIIYLIVKCRKFHQFFFSFYLKACGKKALGLS
jgi:hypothetical protein